MPHFVPPKDQIDVCIDCEYRYICTDCRAFNNDLDTKPKKPEKCEYDQYTGNWN
jgi:hypothetical protein